MEVFVTGMGLLSTLGNLTESWQKLLAGKTGIKLAQPFPGLPPYPMGLIGEKPANLTEITLKILNATLADAHLKPPLTDCGVVIGSSRGCQGLWEEIRANSGLSLENWLDTLPHQAAITTAREMGATGIVSAPMAACATGITAIAQGVELIQQGKCQRVIAGAVETPITPLTLAGFEKMGALAHSGCYPFDKEREGLVLGEGGAMFMLESAELAYRRGASIYGKVLGFSLTCDAYHLSTPAPDHYAAIIALKQCLDRSGLTPTDIDYIHPHGTSTRLNDDVEASIIQAIFPHAVAVSGSKGATGHTLGASGVLSIAFSLMALKEQKIPPCVGLKESAFPLNLIRETESQTIQKVLCFSFGFGGQNAIIALTDSVREIPEQARAKFEG